jgi:hypothetical protein
VLPRRGKAHTPRPKSACYTVPGLRLSGHRIAAISRRCRHRRAGVCFGSGRRRVTREDEIAVLDSRVAWEARFAGNVAIRAISQNVSQDIDMFVVRLAAPLGSRYQSRADDDRIKAISCDAVGRAAIARSQREYVQHRRYGRNGWQGEFKLLRPQRPSLVRSAFRSRGAGLPVGFPGGYRRGIASLFS